MPRFTRRLAAVAVALLAVLAACQSGPGPTAAGPGKDAADWFRPCPAAAPGGSASGGGTGSRPGGTPMPRVTLECFGSGGPVDLAAPSGVPTVVTVWASWCAPCREELPAFQRYAERAGDRVRVIGVVSGDTQVASLALAKDLGVRFPTLFDKRAELVRSLGAAGLPVTVLIDGNGRMVHLVHLDDGQPLTEPALAELVTRFLGVRTS